MSQSPRRPKTPFECFDGTEGIKAFRIMLVKAQTKQFDTFAKLDKRLEELAGTNEEDRLRICSPFVHSRLVYAVDHGVSVPRFKRDQRVDVRFVKELPFSFSGEMGILDDMYYVAHLEPDIRVTVFRDKDSALIMRAQFELVWSGASSERVDFSTAV